MTDAKEYGKALFLITEEDGSTERVLDDLKIARSVFKTNPDYEKLLDSPAISKDERVSLADAAFSSLNEYLLNLIKILCERREVRIFDKVCDSFVAYYDESRGIERVEAVTAVPMTSAQLSALMKKLGEHLGKRIIVKNTVEPSMLGGVKLRYSGIQLDGSVKTRLDKFEASLKNTVI